LAKNEKYNEKGSCDPNCMIQWDYIHAYNNIKMPTVYTNGVNSLFFLCGNGRREAA
jgi:hypothetical protein